MHAKHVTFIGLGAMGGPMAEHVGAGRDTDLTVYDLSPAALERASAYGRPAESLQQAVAGADVIMTMLPADHHVREAAAAIGAAAPQDSILIDFSTVMPDTIRAVATEDAPRLRVLSGSCMKSVAAAKAGDLTIFLGGDESTLTEVGELVSPMASAVARVGDLEGAKSLKIVNNMMVASLNFVIAEAAVLGQSWGLTYRQLADALLAEGVGGWALQNHFIKHTLAHDLGPGYFSTAYMSKDISLAARLAERYRRPRLFGGLLLASYRGTTALGHGNDFHPSIVRWLETEQVATSVPTDAEGQQKTLADLVAWVRTAERLITLHGTTLAEDSGVQRDRAAALLAQASADSASVRALAAGDDGSWWTGAEPSAAQVVGQTLELASTASATALALETARDFVHLHLDDLHAAAPHTTEV